VDEKKRCPACGEEILAIAKKCKHCGELLDENLARKRDSERRGAVSPERLESVVVQVAPSIENEKVAEMEVFGWMLASRQEIERTGNTTGEVTNNLWGQRVARSKTQVTRYVKLHFQRSSNLPNLARVRALEAEFAALPWPENGGFGCPGCLGLLGVLFMAPRDAGAGSGDYGFAAVILIVAAVWFGIVVARNKTREAERARLRVRAEEIMSEVKVLVAS
jgi:hypothetical protein